MVLTTTESISRLFRLTSGEGQIVLVNICVILISFLIKTCIIRQPHDCPYNGNALTVFDLRSGAIRYAEWYRAYVYWELHSQSLPGLLQAQANL